MDTTPGAAAGTGTTGTGTADTTIGTAGTAGATGTMDTTPGAAAGTGTTGTGTADTTIGTAGATGTTGTTGTTDATTGTAAGTAAAAAAVIGAMSEDDVREMLRTAGYDDVASIERQGDEFRAEAKRDDKDVQLTVRELSGMTLPTAGDVSESELRSQLEQAGYSNVNDVERDGAMHKAKAQRGADELTLRLDATRGAIIEERERS
jgi:hypothetical protein